MAWATTSGIVSPTQVVDTTDSLEFRAPEGTGASPSSLVVSLPVTEADESTDAAVD